MSAPKITLYTNRLCPWAHRAHIALKELGLDYEEVTIDLNTPREPWYLEVNPLRASKLIGNLHSTSAAWSPVLIWNRCPVPCGCSPLTPPPPSGPAENALFRARVAFFVDAFISKVVTHFNAGLRSASEEERDAHGEALVAAVVKEIEPLLAETDSKGPFFGGNEKLTLAEVQTGSFLLRILGLTEHGLVSAKVPTLLEAQAPRFKRWAEATIAQESVNFIWDAKAYADRARARHAPKK
ncbi:hypothetical protein N7478_005060 [Penicillium angulare]|uniref:uncharacterized protein n=1 Tax=Penicillium angulare TaxID=116970 RepID=UPI00253FF3ED|nr:uncharacterized protein N7478_005060 [Penicillium angulare]KAJ5279688.1 hypothetical protein N7478_005060 [Penicillium angulare]